MNLNISSDRAHHRAVLAGILSTEIQFAVTILAAYWFLTTCFVGFETFAPSAGSPSAKVIAAYLVSSPFVFTVCIIASVLYVLIVLAAIAIGRKDGAQFYHWHVAVGLDQRRPFLDTFWATMDGGVLVRGGHLENKNRIGLLAIGNGLMAVASVGSHFAWLFISGYAIFLVWYLMVFISRRWERALGSRQEKFAETQYK